jgi:hypothetical protein
VPSISNDLSLVLIAATLAATVGGCTDFAGPIPGTEQPGTTVQPNTGTGGTGSPSVGGGGTGVTEPPPNMGNASALSFNEDVHPILVAMCGECHAEPAGGLPGHGAADPDDSFAEVVRMAGDVPVYERILARASGIGGFMPPGYVGCEELGTMGCLSQAEYDTIKLWVEQGAMNR